MDKDFSYLVESNKAILQKLDSIENRLDRVEKKIDAIDTKIDNIGQFVATGNEDIIKKLQKA